MADDVEPADAVVAAVREADPDVLVAVGGSQSERIGNGGVVRLPNGLRDAVDQGLRERRLDVPVVPGQLPDPA